VQYKLQMFVSEEINLANELTRYLKDSYLQKHRPVASIRLIVLFNHFFSFIPYLESLQATDSGTIDLILMSYL